MEGVEHNSDTVQADAIIEDYLTEYGIHTHRTKITNVIDGLKPVNRRILLVQDTTTPRKVAAITGSVMEKYHPHGDAAITDSIVRMAQPFNIKITLLHSTSNIGDYGGETAAAGRYLDVGASQFAIDCYSKGIDKKTFEYQQTEIGDGNVEPKFFIPKLPMALLVANFGIGLAYKSEPVTLNMGDVCKLVNKYLKLKTQYGKALSYELLYTKLAKYCIPDFPINVLLRNKQQLLNSYEQGSFSVSTLVDGTMDISPHSITIRTMPYGVKPKEIWAKLGLMRKDKATNFVNSNIQRIEDYGNGPDETQIVLSLKRGISPFSILTELKHLIGFTKRWTPNYLYSMPDNSLNYLNPITVMEAWYEERTKSIKAELRIGQRRNLEEIRKVTALIKIGDNILDVVKILRNATSVEDAYPLLMKKYELTKAQTMTIMKYQLANIPKKSKEELAVMLANVKEANNELQSKFFNIDKQISQDAETLMTRYPVYAKRSCNTSKTIGYIATMGGVIQFSSYEELFSLLTEFTKQTVKMELYPHRPKHKYLMHESTVMSNDTISLPKENVGTRIVACKNMLKYTIVLDKKRCVFRMNKIVHANLGKSKLFYTNDRIISISKTGDVQSLNASDIPLRNNINSRGVNSNHAFIGSLPDDEFWVAYSIEKNIIVFQKVQIGGRIMLPPGTITKTHIFGIFPTTGVAGFSISDDCVSKSAIRHILVEDTSVFNTDKVVIKINSKVNNDYDVKISNIAGLYRINK
jgi:DNA gyrase/topoisomerase IV subunit A